MRLLVQGWTIAAAARRLHIAMPRPDVIAKRTELDLPGQLEQEIVGYPVDAGSPNLRRGITPSWAKLTLVVRDQQLTPEQQIVGAVFLGKAYDYAPKSGMTRMACVTACARRCCRVPVKLNVLTVAACAGRSTAT